MAALVRTVLVWAALIGASRAEAAPNVVIVETPDPALRALATQIGLHARAGTAIITTRADVADVSRFTVVASELVAGGATLVVWVAPGDEQTYVVYVAGRHPDRALIELVRFERSTLPAEI